MIAHKFSFKNLIYLHYDRISCWNIVWSNRKHNATFCDIDNFFQCLAVFTFVRKYIIYILLWKPYHMSGKKLNVCLQIRSELLLCCSDINSITSQKHFSAVSKRIVNYLQKPKLAKVITLMNCHRVIWKWYFSNKIMHYFLYIKAFLRFQRKKQHWNGTHSRFLEFFGNSWNLN